MKLPKWATALDLLAVVMALVTASVAITGGFRILEYGFRISLMDWTRPAMWSAAAILIRHVLVRRDPLPQRVAAVVVGWYRHPDTRVVLPIHLASRFGILLVGFLAVVLIGFPPEASARWKLYSNDLLDLPARWDTGWYLGIAHVGYAFDPAVGPEVYQNIAFFPAFPMAMRMAAPFFGRHTLWTGVLVSLVAFYFALVYLLRLARSELGDADQAATAVMLIAAYPFAVFFSAAYTEALFLLTLVGAVYHYRQNQLWRSACWGFLCGLTRPNGFLLSIALGLMAVAPVWDAARWRPMVPSTFAWSASADKPPVEWRTIGARLLAAAAPGFGMLAFSAFIYRLTGSPFKWTAQNAAWGRVYRSLDSIVTDRAAFIVDNGLYSYVNTRSIDLFYAIAVLLALVAIWPVYRRLGLPYAVLILVTLLPPMAAGGLLSMGRVTSILFPVFLWMGAAVPARHRTAWIALFACLQGFVAVMFFTWRPMF